MKLGQRVMLIANQCLIDVAPPPIGAIGEIVGGLDEDGDYEVLFPEYPCPTINDPSWFVFASYLIPIDEPPAEDSEEHDLVIELQNCW